MPAARPREAAANPPGYERRRPEQTPLYRLVRAHYEKFAAEVDAHGTSLPQFVKDEFETYLECGILANGFMRLRCDNCACDTLVARKGQALTIAYLSCNNNLHGPTSQN